MTRLIPAAARPSIVTASDAAAAVGVSRATLYRWGKLSRRNRLESRSRRPHSPRGPAWSADLVSAVRELRAHYPMEGKTRIAVLLRREGHAGSESTVGHIRKRLVAQGACPRDAKPQGPGETVQRDTLTIPFRPGTPRRQAVHRLRSPRQVDMRPSLAPRQRTQRQALPRQTPGRPALPRLPIQVDSGSEFRADFERECRNRSIALFERPPRSPQLSGHVERNNGAWRYEFHASWDLPDSALDDLNRWIDAFADGFNTFRPPQALDGQTSAHCLQSPTAKETPTPHMP